MIDIKQHSLYKAMEVDSILANIFNIYLKKFWILFAFSFIGVFIIQMIFYYLGFFELMQIDDPEELLRTFSLLFKKVGIVSISSVVIYGILNSFLVSYLFNSDLDPKANAGEFFIESISKYSVHMIFFLMLTILIFIAGAFVGILALIIGLFVAMLYLGTVFMIGGAIVVAEEKNAIDTIGRCFNLTHKDFWPALGTFVLFILIMILISIVMSALVSIPFVIMFFENFRETGSILEAFSIQNYDIGIWAVVISSITSAITYPLYAILSVVLYLKLKFTEDQKNIQIQ